MKGKVVVLYPNLYALDMFTRAEVRGLEIHARAIVPTAILAAIHHLVGLRLSNVGHIVFAGQVLGVRLAAFHVFLLRHLSAQRPLPLCERHVLRLYNPRNPRWALSLGIVVGVNQLSNS